jgi:hypothetical protein
MAVVSIDSDDSKDDEIEKVANFAEAYSLDTTSSIVPITTDTVWYLDSGATRHVTGNRILLKNLVNSSIIKTVRLAGRHFHRSW